MFVSDYLWFITVAAGPLVLGLVIAWAIFKRRRLSFQERKDQERSVNKLYGNGDR